MSETSTTALLVGTRDMLDTRSNVLTATVPRGEIEDALALDPPAELTLEVLRRPDGADDVERAMVSVAWKRTDLESVLADPDAEAITFSFDPAELEQAIDWDVEGHGLRETAAVLTIAAAAAAAGASGAFGAVHEEASLSERGIGVQAAATTHTEASLAERGIGVEPAAATHDEASLTARGIDTGSPALHDEATFAARGIDAGTPQASHDEASLTARGIDTGSPALHDEATLAARDIYPGSPRAIHDEMTLAARGIDQGSLPAVHDETTLTARGIDPGGPVPVSDTGSGFELPSVDSGAVAGVAGRVGARVVRDPASVR